MGEGVIRGIAAELGRGYGEPEKKEIGGMIHVDVALECIAYCLMDLMVTQRGQSIFRKFT